MDPLIHIQTLQYKEQKKSFGTSNSPNKRLVCANFFFEVLTSIFCDYELFIWYTLNKVISTKFKSFKVLDISVNRNYNDLTTLFCQNSNYSRTSIIRRPHYPTAAIIQAEIHWISQKFVNVKQCIFNGE